MKLIKLIIRAVIAIIVYLTGMLTATGAESDVAVMADSLAYSSPIDSISDLSLGEVTVTGQSARRRVADGVAGVERLELEALAALPALFGETDIIKSITLMPGVHSEGEGAGGFEVRGGTSAQNLTLLDGMTLNNTTHVMGIFSTFNNDALGVATLYKGPIPSTFGGATSAVLETSLAPGDMEQYHASATIGLLAAKIYAEGPIIKDRLSLAVSARRSYVDLFLKMVPEYRSTVMNFYDVTAKMRYRSDRGDYYDLSFLTARDNMGISDLMLMHWGNTGVSFNYNARRGDNWRFIVNAAYSNYSADMAMNIMRTDQALKEYIRDVSVNGRAIYSFSDNHSLEFGLRSEMLRVKTGEFLLNATVEKEIRSGWQNSLWLNYDGTFDEKLSVCAGLRLSSFSSLPGHQFHQYASSITPAPDFSAKTYIDAEPRVSLKYNPVENHSFRAGAGVTSGNLHAIRTNSTSFPFDRYTISSAEIRPQRAIQYSIGYFGMTSDAAYDWSVEGYYKTLKNVYDYMDGRHMLSSVNLESIISGGKGRSYGLELMVRKNTGRLTGWISYTLSKTQARIDDINYGRWYDATNDHRHSLAAVATYRLTDHWKLSGSWTFSSGQPLTAPDAKFQLDGTTCYYYSERNGYRTPSSHRLDLSAIYTRQGRHATTSWSFGFYNIYNHYSPFVVYFEDDPTKPSGTRAVQQSLYGLIPFVSYTLQF